MSDSTPEDDVVPGRPRGGRAGDDDDRGHLAVARLGGGGGRHTGSGQHAERRDEGEDWDEGGAEPAGAEQVIPRGSLSWAVVGSHGPVCPM